MPMRNVSGVKKLLLLVFAISGASTLIYEVVWTRPLQLVFGSTVYAVSTMLATFMIGFSLGSYLFRNRADISNNPLLLLSAVEFGIGAYGLIIIPLFSLLPLAYLSFHVIPGYQFLQFILCFLVLITPATLIGAVWPLINRIYADANNLGRDSGILYSFNSLGCVLGSFSAGFLLVPTLGVTMTCSFAAFLNIIAALLALILWRARK